MSNSEMSELPVIEEEEATADIARIYAEIKRDLQIPVVPNYAKAMAVSPAALTIYVGIPTQLLPAHHAAGVTDGHDPLHHCRDRQLPVLQRQQRACLPHPGS